MQDWSFAFDHKALWILLALVILAYLLRWLLAASPPYFLFSQLSIFSSKKSRRLAWMQLPQRLYQIALCSFALAFIDPHFLLPNSPIVSNLPPTEGIAIYLILDQSGSMTEKVITRGTDGRRQVIPKIDLLKQVTKQFIINRPRDLIGLVEFARIPHVVAPLTLDHTVLQEKIDQFDTVHNKDEDGTAMGYAIFKTANLIAATRHFAQEIKEAAAPAYEIKNTIIIVVTDGLQDPSVLDKGNRLRTLELEEAAQYVKSEGIRLYIINVDPNFGLDQFAPHRNLMERITRLTGGDFYLVDDEKNLQDIYATIDHLEKSAIESNINQVQQHWSLYPFLISLGLCSFFIAGILQMTWLRIVP